MERQKKVNVSLYLDKDLHDRLKAMAAEDNRKLSNMIEHLIKKAVSEK